MTSGYPATSSLPGKNAMAAFLLMMASTGHATAHGSRRTAPDTTGNPTTAWTTAAGGTAQVRMTTGDDFWVSCDEFASWDYCQVGYDDGIDWSCYGPWIWEDCSGYYWQSDYCTDVCGWWYSPDEDDDWSDDWWVSCDEFASWDACWW